MKTIKIPMTHNDGTKYHWTVISSNRTCLVAGHKPRAMRGWEFTDHDRYTRFVEGNWKDLVDHFQLVASSYGMTCNIS